MSEARPELPEVSVDESRLADEAADAAGRDQLMTLLVITGRGEQHGEPGSGAREPGADVETVVIAETDVQEHG